MITSNEIVDNDSLWVDIDVSLVRISVHSKKLGGNIRDEIINQRDLLLQAKDLSNKLDKGEKIEEAIKNLFLENLKGLQSFINKNRIDDNHNYTVLTESIRIMINSFEKFNWN